MLDGYRNFRARISAWIFSTPAEFGVAKMGYVTLPQEEVTLRFLVVVLVTSPRDFGLLLQLHKFRAFHISRCKWETNATAFFKIPHSFDPPCVSPRSPAVPFTKRSLPIALTFRNYPHIRAGGNVNLQAISPNVITYSVIALHFWRNLHHRRFIVFWADRLPHRHVLALKITGTIVTAPASLLTNRVVEVAAKSWKFRMELHFVPCIPGVPVWNANFFF